MQTFISIFFLLAVLMDGGSSVHLPEPAKTSPIPALQQIIRQQEEAWNRGDPEAWSSVFSEEADFVNIRGELFQGRVAIARLHARIFGAPFEGSHTTMRIRRLTLLSSEAALIQTENEVTSFNVLPPGVVPTTPGSLRSRLKYIAVKRGAHWKIITGQNTAILPSHPLISDSAIATPK